MGLHASGHSSTNRPGAAEFRMSISKFPGNSNALLSFQQSCVLSNPARPARPTLARKVVDALIVDALIPAWVRVKDCKGWGPTEHWLCGKEETSQGSEPSGSGWGAAIQTLSGIQALRCNKAPMISWMNKVDLSTRTADLCD